MISLSAADDLEPEISFSLRPFDDTGWVFEDKYDGFRMVA
jgi:ATP-dependent DNA ligase